MTIASLNRLFTSFSNPALLPNYWQRFSSQTCYVVILDSINLCEKDTCHCKTTEDSFKTDPFLCQQLATKTNALYKSNASYKTLILENLNLCEKDPCHCKTTEDSFKTDPFLCQQLYRTSIVFEETLRKN